MNNSIEPIVKIRPKAKPTDAPKLTAPVQDSVNSVPPAAVVEAGSQQQPVRVKTSDLITSAPFSNLLPIDAETYEAIKADSESSGWKHSHPLHVWRKTNKLVLIDGHTRLKVAIELRIEEVYVFVHEFKSEDEALAFAIACQINRRNLRDGDLVRLVQVHDKKLEPGKGQARENGKFVPVASGDATGKSAAGTAELFGTSLSKIEKSRRILACDDKKLIQNVCENRIRLNAAVERLRKEAARAGRSATKTKKTQKADLGQLKPTVTTDIAFSTWSPISRKTVVSINPADPPTAEFNVAEDLNVSLKKAVLRKLFKKHGHLRVLVSPTVDPLTDSINDQAVQQILVAAEDAAPLEFLLWTRSPERLASFNFPANCRVGVRVTSQTDADAAKAHLLAVNGSRWLIVNEVTKPLEIDWLDQVDWVVVENVEGGPEPSPEALAALVVQAGQGDEVRLFFARDSAYRATAWPKPLQEPMGDEAAGDGGAQTDTDDEEESADGEGYQSDE